MAESIFSGQYTGAYEGSYAGAYAGDYSTAYEGTYSSSFVGDYSSAYEGSQVGAYVGLFSGGFEGAYEAAYVGEYTQSYLGGGYQGLYSGGYTGPWPGAPGSSYKLYSGVFTGTYDESYVAAYEGQYEGAYEGLYSGGVTATYSEGNYVANYEGLYSTAFTGQYAGGYAGSYTGAYESLWGAFSAQFSGTFSGSFSGNFSTAYLGSYDANYVAEYLGMYSGQYEGLYSGAFEGAYSGQYEGAYERNYTGTYSGAYSQAYSLKIGDVKVVTSGGHATLSSGGTSDSPSTVTTKSSGSVEATVTSGGGISVVGGSNQPGKSVTTRIASDDTIVHLGIVDLENLTVNLKPKAPEPGQKPTGLGTNTAPFGDLFLQGNTLTLSTRSLGITEVGGAEYLDFGSNTIIGATQITGDRLLAFGDQLKISQLTDVNLSGIQNGYILKWNTSTGKWQPGDPTTTAAVDLSASTIGDLSNVVEEAYADKSLWQYNSGLGAWRSVNLDLLEFTDFQTAGTLTVNTEVVYSTTRTIQAAAGEVVADSFNINTYRTAKYLVTCEDYTTDNQGYWTGEVNLAHDGTNTALTVYGEVELGVISMSPTIASDISGANVRLKVTTTSDQQVVTVHRTVCTKYTA